MATDEIVHGGDDIAPELLERRICDFDLQIEGRALERVIDRFRAELEACGITHVKPAFYLTDEWGVPEGTVAIGIPFYLADDQLLRLHGMRGVIVEGDGEQDILRYLRHEMGHVVNYAYRLFAAPEWTELFGQMSLPYEEEYSAVPFSSDFVRHLPGSYAQKHPDEDWAETFAVWVTPGLPWRELYADSPGALRKIEYCDRTMRSLRDQPPLVTSTELDYDVQRITTTLQDYYADGQWSIRIPRSLDSDLQAIFRPRSEGTTELEDACELLRRHQRAMAVSVYRWSAVPPEFVLRLTAHLIARAQELGLRYPKADRELVLIDLTAFLTMLSANHKG
jgi:hypothetical protein